MKLTKISYKTKDWELVDLELDQVNLIVGKNGTGKSRTLDIIKSLVRIFDQKSDRFLNAQWDLTFVNSANEILIYRFETTFNSNNDARVVSESLFSNNAELISRNPDSVAYVYNATIGVKEETNPPYNKLVLHTNRDVKKYPFIDELCVWAEESYGCLFANIDAFARASQPEYFESNIGDLGIPSLYELLSEDSRSIVIKNFNSIGYSIETIEPINLGTSVLLIINEKDVISIGHFQMAQGMLRALFILIYIEYLFSKRKPAMIVVDDLCEGLDYDRATKLGKLIFDKCLNSNIQLVATSNDSFLMEVVDIKYWNVLTRKGKVVTALNNKNHPKLFQDFKFTGLSNFDFFSSDYINQNITS